MFLSTKFQYYGVFIHNNQHDTAKYIHFLYFPPDNKVIEKEVTKGTDHLSNKRARIHKSYF